MVNKELLENVTDDGKRYLKEVMGIVEDEAFNRERKRKLRSLKHQDANQRLKREPIETDLMVEDSSSAWCGTKVRISKNVNIKLKHITITVTVLPHAGSFSIICSRCLLRLQT